MSRKTEISFYLEVSHCFVAILNNTLHHHFGNLTKSELPFVDR